MFGDEKRQAIIDAYEVPSKHMAVKGRREGEYKGSKYEEWDFDEGLFSTVTPVDGEDNMKKVVMTKKGASLTLHGESFAAADYPNEFLYDGTHLFATMDGNWWQS
jgi:hypothetical protein